MLKIRRSFARVVAELLETEQVGTGGGTSMVLNRQGSATSLVALFIIFMDKKF